MSEKLNVGEPRHPLLMPLLFALFFFVLSLIVYPEYSGGDQVAYRNFYDAVSSLGWRDGFLYYAVNLDSLEPIYFVVAKIFSGVLEKDLVMSLANGCLAFCVMQILQKRVSLGLAILLSFNFYLMVLFFSAERLKFSVLFIAIFALTAGLKRGAAACLAFLAHVQSFLLVGSWLSVALWRRFSRGDGSRFRSVLLFGAALVVFSGIALVLQEHLASKFASYGQRGGEISNISKPIAFMLITLMYARERRVDAFLMHLPIICASFLVGSDRLVIWSYLIFLGFAISYRRGLNFGVVATSIYFFVKGVFFLGDIFEYGDGFYDASMSQIG